MKLTENNAITGGNGSVKISTAFAKLSFHFYANTGNIANAAAMLAALVNTKIQLLKQEIGGEVSRISERSVIDIAEIATSNEGAVRLFTSGGYTRLKFTIEVALKGNCRLRTDEYFTVKMVGVPANIFLDIYATDVLKQAALEFDYVTDKIFAESPKDTPCETTSLLAIPKSTLKRLTLKTSSQQVVYEQEEVDQICSEINPITFIKDGLVTTGAENFYVLDVSKFSKYRVEVTADSTIYAVKTVSIL